MPLAVIVVLTLVLSVLAFVFEDGEEEAVAPLRPDPISRIIERVERERGLTFVRDPDPQPVTPAQAREEGLSSLDEDYPPARRRADADALILLGLLPPGTDLGETIARTYGEAVAGYYNSRTGEMRIVEGAQTANRVLYEMTVAHELTHALEDQRFDFRIDELAGADDPALAYGALVEGSATALMYRYVEARFGAEETLGGLAASAFVPTGDLPPFLMAQLTFPYITGETFVTRLLEVGGGRWDVVNAALRHRPPVSTEQVMHPEKYLRVELPRRVRLAPPPDGWRTLRSGVLGEWFTGRLLARAGGTAAADAAAGWGGDRYALYGRGDDRALAARWTWDTRADAREFLAALRAWGDEGLPDSEPDGRDAWRTPRGAAVLHAEGGAITLVLAPNRALARRIALSGRARAGSSAVRAAGS
jgi:hypothetical protein